MREVNPRGVKYEKISLEDNNMLIGRFEEEEDEGHGERETFLDSRSRASLLNY